MLDTTKSAAAAATASVHFALASRVHLLFTTRRATNSPANDGAKRGEISPEDEIRAALHATWAPFCGAADASDSRSFGRPTSDLGCSARASKVAGPEKSSPEFHSGWIKAASNLQGAS